MEMGINTTTMAWGTLKGESLRGHHAYYLRSTKSKDYDEFEQLRSPLHGVLHSARAKAGDDRPAVRDDEQQPLALEFGWTSARGALRWCVNVSTSAAAMMNWREYWQRVDSRSGVLMKPDEGRIVLPPAHIHQEP